MYIENLEDKIENLDGLSLFCFFCVFVTIIIAVLSIIIGAVLGVVYLIATNTTFIFTIFAIAFGLAVGRVIWALSKSEVKKENA